MSGLLNKTGAVSGILGTTVGTVTAADLSGVLPVGVTGGSGLTALGTVTAGNLSNSAIVYPAGHVVGFELKYTNSFETISLGTANTFYPSTSLILTYTPKVSGSILLVNASIKCSHSQTAGAINTMRVKRTGPSTAYSKVGADGTTLNSSDFWYGGSGINRNTVVPMTTSWEDIAQNNTGVHTYTGEISTNVDSLSGYLNRRGTDDQWGVSSSIWLMEILV